MVQPVSHRQGTPARRIFEPPALAPQADPAPAGSAYFLASLKMRI